jgi:UDP-GlcNAc:undecaprenyl-phosphate GlcNAc-1-phosphate transferase
MNFISIPWLTLIISAAAAFAVSLLAVPPILRWAKTANLFDAPGGRHIHSIPIPRLGGLAIFASIILVTLFALGIAPKLIGLYLGLIIIFATGWLDDIYSLPPSAKFFGQILAASMLVFFGVTISNLTNPLGGIILLAPGLDVLLTLIWVLLIVNTVNLLDGVDGLAGSISAIAALTTCALSLFAIVNQPDTAQLASIVFGASLGFLIYNWHPAKIFMGDSGSHTLGFMLAALSIISGAKLATAGLVLGIPILDVAWTFIRRVRAGQSPLAADRQHLHHRLIERGMSQSAVVATLCLASAGLGLAALLSGSKAKLIAFGVAIILMLLLVRFGSKRR